MKLTPTSVYPYLHKRKTIDEAAVMKGHFMVHPVNTRNNIMKVVMQPDNSLFVKQMGLDALSKSLFQREINAYLFFNNNDKFTTINAAIPVLLDYDADNSIMVTRLVYHAQNLVEHYGENKFFDLTLAKEQATILSAYHIPLDAATDVSMFPKLLPWVLQLDKYAAHEFFANNVESAKIIQLIKDNTLLQGELLKLATTWRYTHFIHGDIKWINFLVTKEAHGFSQKLIDWELADIGEPLWDIAGLLQSYITTWLLGFDNSNPYQHELPNHSKPFDIKYMQPSAQAFLYTYMEQNGYTEAYPVDFFTKVMQLTAARIIQTSVEAITFNAKVEANYMRCIQLAFNILKDPMYALVELFNIKIAANV
jgi:thiamine kinase-like enzyme